MPFEGNVGANYPHFPERFFEMQIKKKRTRNLEEAKPLVNEAWDNKIYVLTAGDFAGVSFTLNH